MDQQKTTLAYEPVAINKYLYICYVRRQCRLGPLVTMICYNLSILLNYILLLSRECSRWSSSLPSRYQQLLYDSCIVQWLKHEL